MAEIRVTLLKDIAELSALIDACTKLTQPKAVQHFISQITKKHQNIESLLTSLKTTHQQEVKLKALKEQADKNHSKIDCLRSHLLTAMDILEQG